MSTTATSSIVDAVKAMVAATQVAKDQRKKTTDVNQATGKNFTSKDKAVLGIDDDRSITWAYPNFEATDSEKFKLLAKACDTTASELASRIVMDWFDKNREAIEPVVADQLRGEQTEEDLQKKLEAIQRQQAATLAKLEALRKK